MLSQIHFFKERDALLCSISFIVMRIFSAVEKTVTILIILCV